MLVRLSACCSDRAAAVEYALLMRPNLLLMARVKEMASGE